MVDIETLKIKINYIIINIFIANVADPVEIIANISSLKVLSLPPSIVVVVGYSYQLDTYKLYERPGSSNHQIHKPGHDPYPSCPTRDQ